MKPSTCRESLAQLLQRHILCIDQATGYLKDIKQAFIDNRLQGMQELIAAPHFDLSEIETLEKERHQLLQACGFDRDDHGFQQCLEWCDDSDQSLSALYLMLVDKLKDLQRSTQVNSLLISKGRDRVRRSIGVLTGVAGAECKTYSSSGQKVDSTQRRNLAIA